jgi:hypothetical protein
VSTGSLALIGGRSFWTGDVTFSNKFDYFLAAHEAELRREFGDEIIDKTKVSGGRRILMNRAYARTYESNTLSGQNIYGNEGYLSDIKISREVVNMYYRNNDIRATGVL